MSIPMSITDAYIFELNHEVETTKRHFSRIEDKHFSFKPHDKSMTMGRLAGHSVETPCMGRRDCKSRCF